MICITHYFEEDQERDNLEESRIGKRNYLEKRRIGKRDNLEKKRIVKRII